MQQTRREEGGVPSPFLGPSIWFNDGREVILFIILIFVIVHKNKHNSITITTKKAIEGKVKGVVMGRIKLHCHHYPTLELTKPLMGQNSLAHLGSP